LVITYGKVIPVALPEAAPDQEMFPVPVPLTVIDPFDAPQAVGLTSVPCVMTG
jgi:hypothetical protein